MKYIYRKNILTKVILISFLSFQPTISYSKEPKSGNIFSKLFSSLSFKNQEANKNQILKSDIDSLNINSLVDFEFSIRDILKNYIDEKNIKKLINNITRKDDKNVDANTIDEFNNLLPKSSSDKLNGQALIRIAKKLGKDEKTKFEIKKNIVIKIISSFGITVTYNDEVKKKDVVDIKKEEEKTIDDASPYMSAIASVAGIAAIGGGGGGGGSSSSCDTSTDGCYRNTRSGIYNSEYTANTALNSHNILRLNDYGYTGEGVKVGVVDSGIDFDHQEFSGKTVLGTDFASSSSGFDDDENGHGTHVASIIAGTRGGTGMRGMAYDATLYSYKVDNDGDNELEGLSSDSAIGNIYDQHVTDGIKISNNSWGGSTSITSVSETSMRSSRAFTITALKSFKNNGGITVFAAGNDYRTQPDSYGAMPYRITELKDAWLVVTAVDLNLRETNYTNRCGVAYDFCVTAIGGGNSSDDPYESAGVYAADANTSNGYVRSSGTSMAAPHVSGLAAALIERFPSLTNTQIVTRIKNTASYVGLTDTSGTSSNSLSTSQKQAIWGYGLVNGTAAISTIGSLIYPTSSNLFNGSQNLNKSLISLPSSVSLSTFETIKNQEFGVFDSFDGARFFVKGSKVFKINKSQFVPIKTSKKILEKEHLNSIKYYNKKDQSLGLYASLVGKAQFIQGSSSFWNEKAGLFRGFSVINDEDIEQLEWKFQFTDSLSLQTFTKKASVDNSLYGSGLSFVFEPKHKMKRAYFGFSKSNPSLNLNLFDVSGISSETSTLEIGGEYFHTENISSFFGLSQTDIENIETKINNFGIEDAKTLGITAGINFKKENNSFIFGFSIPEEFNKGKLSMLVPVGKNSEGDVLWEKRSFKLKQENFIPAIFGWSHKISNNLNFDASIEESRYDNGKLGEAQLSLNFTF